MSSTLHPDAINALVYGDHGAPLEILGPHRKSDTEMVVRTFQPHAKSVALIPHQSQQRVPMQRIHDAGLFEVEIPSVSAKEQHLYRFELSSYENELTQIYDPFAFPPLLTDFDLHLFGEGMHLDIYERMGAHLREIDGVQGVNFAVWAPNAQRVSVIGEFNHWDGRIHPMQMRGKSGVWEIFIPELSEGTIYKYEIKSWNKGYAAEKSDPYGFFAELRPKTASIVKDLNGYSWGDDDWMKARSSRSALNQPMAIYELHMGSWKRKSGWQWLTYREMADELIPYLREMGYTHVELMPIAEHPFDGSWGYQVTGYYAATSRYGSPEDLMYFIDQCHQNNIGVLLDWVPAHFPKDGYALSYFDGSHLYSHEDWRRGEHPDWGTYIFNYGRNEVRNFLLANALFWLRKYHIDGLRVDAVSSMIYLDFSRKDGEWVPNEYGGNENLDAVSFLKQFNEILHREVPGSITVAEESTSWPMVSRPTYIGGLGFTMKWNMGWMHDTLHYISKDPIYRRYSHNSLTFALIYAFTENFVLSLSHDEVVHGKGSLINKIPGDWWQKFATMRLLFGYQYTQPGKKLNFMGQEFGQWQEWSEARELDWNLLEFPTHAQLQRFVRDLNHLYQHEPALYERDFDPSGFEWIEANDADNSVFSYARFAADRSDFVVVVCNFTPVPRDQYRIGVPVPGAYREILNSDLGIYGGGDIGNSSGLRSEEIPWNNQLQSLSLTIPPLGIVLLKLER